MRIIYTLLLLCITVMSAYAQPNSQQKATFALSFQYDLKLSKDQIQQLDSAEYVFLRNYQLGRMELQTEDDYTKAYFDYFRPMLKPQQQEAYDVIVQQYEEMLTQRTKRVEQKARESLKKRFRDLYLTNAQLDSLYTILHAKKTEKTDGLTKRKRKELKDKKQLKQIKQVLDNTQYNKYLVIRRTEEEEVLNLQAGTIQQSFAPLQLTQDQAKSLFDFMEYDKGFDEKGQALSYWEMQDQMLEFLESNLESHQVDAFLIKQREEIAQYETNQRIAQGKDQEYLQAAEKSLAFHQNTLLPELCKIRSIIKDQIEVADQKKIDNLRQKYVQFLVSKEEELIKYHERFFRKFRPDLLRKEKIVLNQYLIIPEVEMFVAQEKIQSEFAQLAKSYKHILASNQTELNRIQKMKNQFEEENFVMTQNWITLKRESSNLSDEQIKQHQLFELLLLSPTVEANVERLKNNRFLF